MLGDPRVFWSMRKPRIPGRICKMTWISSTIIFDVWISSIHLKLYSRIFEIIERSDPRISDTLIELAIVGKHWSIWLWIFKYSIDFWTQIIKPSSTLISTDPLQLLFPDNSLMLNRINSFGRFYIIRLIKFYLFWTYWTLNPLVFLIEIIFLWTSSLTMLRFSPDIGLIVGLICILGMLCVFLNENLFTF